MSDLNDASIDLKNEYEQILIELIKKTNPAFTYTYKVEDKSKISHLFMSQEMLDEVNLTNPPGKDMAVEISLDSSLGYSGQKIVFYKRLDVYEFLNNDSKLSKNEDGSFRLYKSDKGNFNPIIDASAMSRFFKERYGVNEIAEAFVVENIGENRYSATVNNLFGEGCYLLKGSFNFSLVGPDEVITGSQFNYHFITNLDNIPIKHSLGIEEIQNYYAEFSDDLFKEKLIEDGVEGLTEEDMLIIVRNEKNVDPDYPQEMKCLLINNTIDNVPFDVYQIYYDYLDISDNYGDEPLTIQVARTTIESNTNPNPNNPSYDAIKFRTSISKEILYLLEIEAIDSGGWAEPLVVPSVMITGDWEYNVDGPVTMAAEPFSYLTEDVDPNYLSDINYKTVHLKGSVVAILEYSDWAI